MANNFETQYEQLITGFEGKRREMLSLMTTVVPKPTEMHRRKWRLKEIENSITDIKQTIAACNQQLDRERNKLDQLNAESDRLQAQERKLLEDLKLLEGVTGMQAILPCDPKNNVMADINRYAELFRTQFSDFYLSLPQIDQELPSDPTLERDAKILISTLRDYILLNFDNRSAEATLSKQVVDKTNELNALQKRIADDEARIDREVAAQKYRIEDSANRMKDSIRQQGQQLRKQGRKISEELQKAQTELLARVEELERKQKRLKSRLISLKSQNRALKENFSRRSNEIELELDKFENRIEAIKHNPALADSNLINIALILSNKSTKINKAVHDIRLDIESFNSWLKS